jgi:hypothetical protein
LRRCSDSSSEVLDRRGADQRRLPAGVAVLDVGQHGVELALAVEEHLVGRILAHGRAVGRDHDDLQPIDALELERLGVGGAGHARKLAVHAEQVLEGDAGQGLVFALHRHAFLGFDRLVQAVGPAATGQRAAGEFIDDHHFAIAHDVVDVALVDSVGAQRRVEVVHDAQVAGAVQAVLFVFEDAGLAQQVLGVQHAGFGQVHLLALLVDPEVALAVLGFLPDQLRDYAVDADVEFRRIVGRAGNDQRRARFVDQDGVDLVDDRVCRPRW